MKDKLFRLNLFGFAFVSIFGTTCHFLYQLCGYSRISGIFFPVNESVWEHLKMLFLPYLVWGIAESIICKSDLKKWFAKAIGLISGMIFIVAFYYTSYGITGNNNDTLNIVSFFVGIIIAFFTEEKATQAEKYNYKTLNTFGILIFVTFAFLFTIFTFAPPLIPLFKSPDSNTFGI